MIHELQVYLQSHLSLASVLEIIILTYMIYQLFSWIKGTQAEQVVKGLIVLSILMPISQIFGLTTVTFLIQSMFTWIFLLLIVLFQPELRSALEQIGSNKFINRVVWGDTSRVEKAINAITESVAELAETKTGALIVCEAQTGLLNIANTGTILNARISPSLIMNLFYNKAPLHDGAVIVSLGEDKIIAAGCVLPLTNKTNLPQQFGTRHRAGIGISEHSDAVTIIVSEETGKVTLTKGGFYDHDVSVDEVKEYLIQQFLEPLEEAKNGNSRFSGLKRAYNKVFKSSHEQ